MSDIYKEAYWQVLCEFVHPSAFCEQTTSNKILAKIVFLNIFEDIRTCSRIYRVAGLNNEKTFIKRENMKS